jgi:hypothetical protein
MQKFHNSIIAEKNYKDEEDKEDKEDNKNFKKPLFELEIESACQLFIPFIF